ncbi:MAG TPA: N-acetylneuraminate synthase family protein [Acidobacteriota bacterium]|jgi:N-acetylneuraminate synthase/sialic acid synthase|nr:N-acetylneuraminate synthase [Acidobacteriota bacterium]HJO29409.1 N-acetylneuraminate synthase family protein [Acidobacteriota bacterium]|tara:strand:+ start:102 stop:1193 length:1092 start_codon:yes stop_codon:yes gene_type:complete
MPPELSIDGEVISDDSDCYVIAEVGHNHQGSLEGCKELFRQAKDCGASAVKLQKRNNRELYTSELYNRPYDNRNSYGASYGEHREALEFGLEEYTELKNYCEEIDITFFATAFDFSSADFLEDLGVPAYKIASGDLKNTPLLEHVAQFGKPMIVSTGASVLEDVKRAYDTIMPINPQLCLMQCTAGYPAEFEELDLGVVTTYKDLFPDVVIGYSGHDNSISMPLVAYCLGARMVEKHFTLNRAMKGTDHAFSLEPTGLRKMVRDLKRARLAIGAGEKQCYPSEASAGIKMGKKITAARDLEAGHVLTRDDLVLKSPGDGLCPYELPHVIGKVLTSAIPCEAPISWELLEHSDDGEDPSIGRPE